ncbi:MAG: PHP domain-containing protein [Lachnospiraceae bacterium]|nr:PHP domain-containing protein [Lachnospiraceae bacterium]
MNRILRKPNVWDLHIHTPLGTPTKKNYGGVSAEDFVDDVIKLYSETGNKIGMISFTDHNKINSDAYKIFRRKSNIAIIPGIEMDIFLTENDKDSKHIIFYFDEQELDNIDELKLLIESYIETNKKVFFEPFVMHLIHNKKCFAVSPHAFKQGKRGINSDWFDETSADKGASRFSGLFFPFWEAGGKSDICKAIEFLEEQYGVEDNQQAVIAFSDSADFDKMRKYIENPHQYFLCLNSFKGLLLAGSDIDRIVYEYEERPESNPSEKIKNIIVSNDLKTPKNAERIEIELSDRLNVIVGGRGKGKSALLGAIVSGINESLIEDSSRASFVKKFNIQIKNFKDMPMASDTKIVYFSQSFINHLFDNDRQDKLEKFFDKQFADNSDISNGIADVLAFIEKNKVHEVVDDINVLDDLKNLVCIAKKSPDLQIASRKCALISLHKDNLGYEQIIKQLLPKDKEIWNEQLEKELHKFISTLLENISRSNYKRIEEIKFSQLVRKKIEQQKKKRSKEDERKIEARNKIEQKLRYLYTKELERIRQINMLYKIDTAMTELKMQYQIYSGEGENKIYFVSVANKEHPVEYARRQIIESINKTKIRNVDKKTYEEIFKIYATTEESVYPIKDSLDFYDLVKKIASLEGMYSKKIQRIIYKNAEGYVDLHKTSPGTQTNAVMEFILHSDSTSTLLIDQPEDNIDNEARYAQLTKWIRKQKYKRQIILVTHDANIVINGDAECVIIANHTGDKFNYEYGALEYGDVLDKAAVILDGGKTAIHRRIDKYGE